MDVELFFEGEEGLSVPEHLVSELDSARWDDLETTVAALVTGPEAAR